jgi:hypothetical protein
LVEDFIKAIISLPITIAHIHITLPNIYLVRNLARFGAIVPWWFKSLVQALSGAGAISDPAKLVKLEFGTSKVYVKWRFKRVFLVSFFFSVFFWVFLMITGNRDHFG